VVYAELKLEQEKESYDSWLNNEGVLLADKIAPKKRLSKEYSAKVNLSTYFIVNYFILIITSFSKFFT
jgi:hypothetical protein